MCRFNTFAKCINKLVSVYHIYFKYSMHFILCIVVMRRPHLCKIFAIKNDIIMMGDRFWKITRIARILMGHILRVIHYTYWILILLLPVLFCKNWITKNNGNTKILLFFFLLRNNRYLRILWKCILIIRIFPKQLTYYKLTVLNG